MPNPYHNHVGEFCSKEGMQTSIKMLTETGQLDRALQLTSEFKTIEDTASKKAFFSTSQASQVIVGESVDNLVRSSTYRLYQEKDHAVAHCGLLLENVSDKDLTAVVKKLESEQEVWTEVVLNPALDAEETRSQDFKTKTGHGSYSELNQERNAALVDAEVASRQIFNKIKEEAIAQGVPANYAQYFVKSTQTRMGYTDSYYLTASTKVERASELAPVDFKSFPVNIKDKDIKEKYVQALEKVTSAPENQAKIAKINATVEKYNTLNSALKEAPTPIGGVEKARKLVEARTRVEAYSRLIESVQGLQVWRQKLRTAGVKTNRITPVSVSTLNGSQVKVDNKGVVKNMWAVNKNTSGESSVDRIVGVKANESYTDSHLLLGESGRSYNSLTHYHSYSSTKTDSQIIIDDTVKGSKTLDGKVNFSASYDSGD